MSSNEPVGYVSFANFPQTTVSNGGTAALSQGASEQWTVSSSATFPGVSTSPPTTFCVADTAATSEIVQVTAITSNVWGVTRGAEGTTPVTHATNFTVQQVVTAGALQNFVQYPNSGITAATTITTTGTIGSYIPSANDVPATGAVYDFSAFGTIHNSTNTATIATLWGTTTIATAVSGANGVLGTRMAAGSTWWLEGKVQCYGATTMVTGFNFQAATGSTISTLVGASSAGTVITGSTGPLTIFVGSSAWTLVTTGFYAHRIS